MGFGRCKSYAERSDPKVEAIRVTRTDYTAKMVRDLAYGDIVQIGLEEFKAIGLYYGGPAKKESELYKGFPIYWITLEWLRGPEVRTGDKKRVTIHRPGCHLCMVVGHEEQEE